MSTPKKLPRETLAVSVTIPEAKALVEGAKDVFIVPAKHAPRESRGRWRVEFSRHRAESFAAEEAALAAMPAPYWIGRRMHVRETWAPMSRKDPFTGEDVTAAFGLVERTDPEGRPVLVGYAATVPANMEWSDGDGFADTKSHWRSAASMPRWASRVVVEVTTSYLIRANDIDMGDIVRSGIFYGTDPSTTTASVEARYAHAWDARYGASYPWKANPRVWRIVIGTLDIATSAAPPRKDTDDDTSTR